MLDPCGTCAAAHWLWGVLESASNPNLDISYRCNFTCGTVYALNELYILGLWSLERHRIRGNKATFVAFRQPWCWHERKGWPFSQRPPTSSVAFVGPRQYEAQPSAVATTHTEFEPVAASCHEITLPICIPTARRADILSFMPQAVSHCHESPSLVRFDASACRVLRWA